MTPEFVSHYTGICLFCQLVICWLQHPGGEEVLLEQAGMLQDYYLFEVKCHDIVFFVCYSAGFLQVFDRFSRNFGSDPHLFRIILYSCL